MIEKILERASMDPYAGTDETGSKVAGQSVQMLVSNTLHTTMLEVTANKRVPRVFTGNTPG